MDSGDVEVDSVYDPSVENREIVIKFIIFGFIIPGFILYKLFGKKVAIGYVLLAYAFISWFGIGLRNTGPVALTEEYKKETNKYYIYAVLIGIAIFYVLNKYLK